MYLSVRRARDIGHEAELAVTVVVGGIQANA